MDRGRLWLICRWKFTVVSYLRSRRRRWQTTLFRLLSTLMPLQTGAISLLGYDLAVRRRVRRVIGCISITTSIEN